MKIDKSFIIFGRMFITSIYLSSKIFNCWIIIFDTIVLSLSSHGRYTFMMDNLVFFPFNCHKGLSSWSFIVFSSSCESSTQWWCSHYCWSSWFVDSRQLCCRFRSYDNFFLPTFTDDFVEPFLSLSCVSNEYFFHKGKQSQLGDVEWNRKLIPKYV